MPAPTVTPDPERRGRLLALLDVALELPADGIDAWLRALDGDEPEVAAELRRVLDSRTRADAVAFLEAPPPLPTITRAGERIGPYALVAPLGEGGMGSVWLAERSDGRFEGRVAIKLLHSGLVRPSHLERFRREGQLLARLSHPNIARLLDAGITDGGQPYLVIEYFDGRPIDVACDAAALDVRARLRAFLDVLDAVAHAHARLVVHRDIKPGNVLVGADGAVKLLDFGIAKLLDTEGTDAHALTLESGRAFTPQYAAPEQIAGDAATTATDIYALGMLLYVLLAGTPPAPPRGEMHSTPRASAVAALRGDVRRARALEGDLDTILAKALRAEPRERYATVDAFAEDLRRHLRGQTVSARPPTFAYRASRFIAQHRGAVSAIGAGLVAVVAFAGVAAWQAREARAQRVVAERHAAIASARGLAAYAIAQAPLRTDLSLLLGAEAVKRHAAGETSVGLYTALDAARHLVRFRADLGTDLRGIALTHDRREAVTVDGSGIVRRYALAEHRQLAERATGARAALGIYYRADERVIVVPGERGGEVLDARTLEPARDVARVASPDATRIAFTDLTDDGTLAVAGVYGGDTVVVSDAHTGRERVRFRPAPCAGLTHVAFAHPGTDVTVGCEDSVHVYDAAGRRLRGKASAAVSSVETSPDGRHAAIVVFDNEPSLVDRATLQPLVATLSLPGGRAYATRFSPSGRYYALGTDTGRVAVWDVRAKREIARFGALEDGVFAVEWLADDFEWQPGRGIVGDARLLVATRSTTTEWDLASPTLAGRPATDLDLPPVPYHEDAIDARHDLAWREATPANGARTTLEGVSLHDGAVRRSFDVDASDVASLTVSPDGARLFATAVRGREPAAAPSLLVLATSDGHVLHRLDWPANTAPVGAGDAAPSLSARFSGDGRRLAVVAHGRLLLWDVSTGRPLATADVHPLTRVIAWSPDDRRLAATREAAVVTLFDSTTLRQTATFERDVDYTIKQMYPSAALGGIVVTSESGEVYVVDPDTAKLVGEPFRAGGSQLQRSAVSPDGSRRAAWGSDGAVRIWDVPTRLAVSPPLRGHPAGRVFNRLWFGADGTLSSYTPGLRIDWDLDLPHLADAACTIAGRALTAIEWRQFVGDVDYAPACRPR